MIKYYLFILIWFSGDTFSDGPGSYPKIQQVFDDASSYCALVEGDQTTIYKYGCLTGKEKYSIPGWHPHGYLRKQGSIFISLYPGLNLLPLDVSNNEVMIEVWKNGHIFHQVKLSSLINSMSSLERTVPHYHWGMFKEVKGDIIYMKTVEGTAEFNFMNGKITLKK